MKTINSRFGEIEYSDDNLVIFPKGLIGFENLRHFIVMPRTKEGPLFWIQSAEDQEIAFILTDPTNFFPDYALEPDAEEQRLLEMQADSVCYALSVVTVTPEQKITLNLVAPIAVPQIWASGPAPRTPCTSAGPIARRCGAAERLPSFSRTRGMAAGPGPGSGCTWPAPR